MALLQPGVWGIDLGQCGLKAIRLENVGGEVTATAFDYIEHPKILSQPDADPDQLTREALEKFLSRNTLRGDIIVIGVPGQSGLARFVKLPPVEEKKIGDIVRFEAKQQIPFPLEEVVWDFQKLGSGVVTDGYALETEIGLFAMKRDMVNRYLQHFKDVNVEVHMVQMAPLALCNFVSYDLLEKGTEGAGGEEEEGGKKNCVVALDIGTDSSNLVITDGERIIWQRPIPLGGNHFTRALTKDLKLTFAKAEHTKRNAAKSPELKKILLALKPVLNDFVGEVQRSLGYFTNTHRDATIEYMVGLGNAFRLPGLQKFLQEKLQLEVRKLQKLQRATGESVVGAPQFKENVLSFAVAYGLALQGLRITRLHTNLLPHEIQMERMVRAKKPWAAAAAAALILAAAGLTFGRSMEYKAVHNDGVKKAKDRVAAELKRGKQIQTDYAAKEEEAKRSEEAVKRIAAGIDERFNWNLLFKYIHDALPLPDGQRLAKRTRFNFESLKTYYEKGGQKAYQDLKERRHSLAAGLAPRPGDDKLDEEVKKTLVQINIEGIDALYAPDLATFWDRMKTEPLLPGMTEREQKEIKDGAKEALPKSGWVVEVRGFTQHRDYERFVLNTLVENLAVPEAAGSKPSSEMERDVKKKVSHVFLYKFKRDDNPEPGVFDVIAVTSLREVLGGAAPVRGGPRGRFGGPTPGGAAAVAASADSWTPIGDVGSATFTGAPVAKVGKKGPPGVAVAAPAAGPNAPATPMDQPTRVRAPRTEFVILFVWQEPLPPEAAAAASP